jgi:hypothetical protein
MDEIIVVDTEDGGVIIQFPELLNPLSSPTGDVWWKIETHHRLYIAEPAPLDDDLAAITRDIARGG